MQGAVFRAQGSARISFRPSSKTPFDGFLGNFQFLLAVLTFGSFSNTLLSVTGFLQVQNFIVILLYIGFILSFRFVNSKILIITPKP